MVDTMLEKGGGVIFIDEAYQLTSGNSPGGGAVLDYLLAEVENLMGKIVFLLAGYKKQMETFYAHNPGIPSRFPIDMEFVDYTDEELLEILDHKIRKGWSGAMQCEEGISGLYGRIVARRIGRGRGHEGFGNARTVENVLDQIARRQATRISKARRKKLKPDDFLFTKEDLIGPAPSEALSNSTGWKKLSQMIGLESVKETVKVLLDSIQVNYERELAEEPLVEYTLNKVFLGNPGTGKTTVAKLYGAILVDLGLLSNGEVVVKNPSDFVGAVIGGSEKQTKGILASTVGKVLVIDEAYGLYGGSTGPGAQNDPFKTAVIDTIVAEVQSVPGDDRCVLLLGYKDPMEDMFQNVNPGLSRRFPMSTAFHFGDFSQAQLEQILEMKLKQSGFVATGEAKKVALEMLDRARNRPNFGNAGEIDIILNDTKARHQKRYSSGQTKSSTLLEAIDFDENFDRAEKTETNVAKLFEGTVGTEEIIAKLQGYQETVRELKGLGEDPKDCIPFNFLFKGPPGTGKTTTAKKMGKVFYDMGFLANAEVVECSVSDLVAQYIGQTGPKVRQCLDKALGKVLFVDEAYRLAEGHFAQEAIDELVDSVTKDKYSKKLIIILAGYDSDIDRLMTVNQGLASRFSETVYFRSLKEGECIALLGSLLSERQKSLKNKNMNKSFDFSVLLAPTSSFQAQLMALFSKLVTQSSWASARDVRTLAKQIFTATIKSKSPGTTTEFALTEEVIIWELEAMWQDRAKRDAQPAWRASRGTRSSYESQPDTGHVIARDTSAKTESATKEEKPSTPPENSNEVPKSMEQQLPVRDGRQAQRDAGVSDEIWEQLQKDAQAAQQRIKETKRLRKQMHAASEANREKIVKRLLEEERKQAEELAKQKELKARGLCPMGYDWIKQATGYRCAGGSHVVPDE
jgi:SpoVK/Ycf46/Vps4 family AAA+-type ATPase